MMKQHVIVPANPGWFVVQAVIELDGTVVAMEQNENDV